MENGKRICRTLKELRKRIADANEIPFEIEECTHIGDCPGTCPKCDMELNYLQIALEMREKQGKPVVLGNLMTEEELRKVFTSDTTDLDIPEPPETFITEGMPTPPTEHDRLLGTLQRHKRK